MQIAALAMPMAAAAPPAPPTKLDPALVALRTALIGLGRAQDDATVSAKLIAGMAFDATKPAPVTFGALTRAFTAAATPLEAGLAQAFTAVREIKDLKLRRSLLMLRHPMRARINDARTLATIGKLPVAAPSFVPARTLAVEGLQRTLVLSHDYVKSAAALLRSAGVVLPPA